MKVWQIATGEPRRDYRQVFIEYDLMILGPGNPGCAFNFDYAMGAPNSIYRQIHSFAHSPQPGDRVLMRLAHDVIAVGQIPQGDDHQYSHNAMFRCIYGWDLQHCRRVVWAEGIELGSLANVFKDAKQKPSFTQVHEHHIVELVRKIAESAFDRSLKPLPTVDTDIYKAEELGVALFAAGISNRNIDEILKALQQAARLCAWYNLDEQKPRPSEHEIISHIILPVFLGLGWSHQQIAIEWNRVDMAFFKATPTNSENCVLILEAKGLGQALSNVLQQPLEYVRYLGLADTRYILTTDGVNLFVYERHGQDWNPDPVGYINFLSLQKQYLLPENTDLVKTLVNLQPGLVYLVS
jgi:hypothetical protein